MISEISTDKAGCGSCLRIVDVPSRAWHSREMRDRYSVRQLLLTMVLSQILAIQGLLLAWSGTLAFAGGAGGLGPICSGAASASLNDSGGAPLVPRAGPDCLSACLMSHTTGTPSDEGASLALPTLYACSAVPRKTTLTVILREPVFLARAPPMLT